MAETKKKNEVKEVKKEKTESSEKTFSGFTFTSETIFVYLVPLVGFIFSFLNTSKCSKRSRFVYNQAGALFIICFPLILLGEIPYAGIVFYIALIVVYVFTVITIIKTMQGEDYRIPGIYDLGHAIWGKNTEKKEEK